MSEESWRVFCAIELPAEVRERAATHAAQVREVASVKARVSWQRAEQLHLTLKFLGEIAESRVASLREAAERAAHQVQPFNLNLEGAGSFPPKGMPKVLWLGVVDASGALARLQKRLEEECAVEGFPREERAFRPHLTLARIRTPEGARTLASVHQRIGFPPIEFAVTQIVWMRSQLGPGGPRHTLISSHELGN